MLSADRFEEAASRVTGLATARHAHLLRGLVRWLRPESVVEIGAFEGGTTVWLARALQENGAGFLTAIDDFSLAPEAYHQLWYHLGTCGVGERVAVHVGPSADLSLWPERVDFAYVDGDHSLIGCRQDVETAIARGASCVVVHDVESWWGPRMWLDLFEFKPGWSVLSVGFDEGLAVALRRPVFGEVRYGETEFPSGCV